LRVCRFVELTPSTIVALAVRADGSLIAVGRENGDIELWDCKNGYICQSVRAAVAAHPSRGPHAWHSSFLIF
jgi:hypothetical protein